MSPRSLAGPALAAVAVALATAAVAPATPAHERHGPNSFAGVCRLSGELVFDEPLGNEPRTTTFTDTAAGTCDGELNGVAGHAIPTTNTVAGSATLSCLGGHASTADTLVFARRYPIRILTESAGALTQFAAHSP